MVGLQVVVVDHNKLVTLFQGNNGGFGGGGDGDNYNSGNQTGQV